MADAITVPTFEQIETILSKLATNYSNLAVLFYDIFYNTTPKEVTFQMYNESGVLQSYTIPNRAMDRAYVLNGEGSPEGVVEAAEGSLYQDLINGILYIKKTSTGSAGWEEFVTAQQLTDLFMEGTGSPEGVVAATKGSLYIDRTNAVLYMKATPNGNTGWVVISANTSDLADRNLGNLTATGLARFANPDLSNITPLAEAKFTAKENASNKKTVINSASTDIDFPSSKAVYTYVNSSITNFADKDLSNITASAEAKFLGTKQIKDCILSAPNGLLNVTTGNAILLHQGTILLLADGVAADGSLNNDIVTLSQDYEGGVPIVTSTSGISGTILFDNTNLRMWYPTSEQFFVSAEEPEVTLVIGLIWYDTDTHTYHYVKDSSGTLIWDIAPMAIVGEYTLDSTGAIATLTPRKPVVVVSEDNLNGAVSEAMDEFYQSEVADRIDEVIDAAIDAAVEAASDIVVDQTYTPASTNAQSGAAIAGAHFLQNAAVGTDSVAIGTSATAAGNTAVAIGKLANSSQENAVAVGSSALAQASRAIQIGTGTNSTASSLSVGFSTNNYQLLDGTTGLIPNARINIDSNPTNGSTNAVSSGGVYTALSNKVSKTGTETIAGTKTFSNGIIAASIISKSNLEGTFTNAISKGTNPSSAEYRSIAFNDGDDTHTTWQSRRLGIVETSVLPSGEVSTILAAYKNEADSEVHAELRVGIQTDGSTYFTFPKCTTQPSTTSSAASNKVNVVIENYNDGFYRRRIWSDGLIEQWGVYSGTLTNGAIVKILLPYSYSDEYYNIQVTGRHIHGKWGYAVVDDSHITSNGFFIMGAGNSSADGVDRAYWYTCGY